MFLVFEIICKAWGKGLDKRFGDGPGWQEQVAGRPLLIALSPALSAAPCSTTPGDCASVAEDASTVVTSVDVGSALSFSAMCVRDHCEKLRSNRRIQFLSKLAPMVVLQPLEF